MYYYRVNGHLCCSLEEGLPYEAVSCPESAKELIWLFAREPGEGRASFKVNDAALMHQEKEDVSWLNKNLLGDVREDGLVQKLIGEGKVRAVNRLHPRFEEILEGKPDKKKKRVHLLAIGDVGSNLLTGLHLLLSLIHIFTITTRINGSHAITCSTSAISRPTIPPGT